MKYGNTYIFCLSTIGVVIVLADLLFDIARFLRASFSFDSASFLLIAVGRFAPLYYLNSFRIHFKYIPFTVKFAKDAFALLKQETPLVMSFPFPFSSIALPSTTDKSKYNLKKRRTVIYDVIKVFDL